MTGAIIIMGVSGCGKSTLGAALARRLGWDFVEGDALHLPASIQKMRAGVPLDDADRWPFLELVARIICASRQAGVVVSCSALKRSYRDFIRTRTGPVTFVLPQLDRDQLFARLAQRRDHFMPPSLLESQLAALETPQPDEHSIVVDGSAATDAQISRVLCAVGIS